MILYDMYQCRLVLWAEEHRRYVVCISWPQKLYMMPLGFSQSSHPAAPSLNPLWKWPPQKLRVPEGILKYRWNECVNKRLLPSAFTKPLAASPWLWLHQISEVSASLSLEMCTSSSGERELSTDVKRAGGSVRKILCRRLVGAFSGRSLRGDEWYKEAVHSGKGKSGTAVLGL